MNVKRLKAIELVQTVMMKTVDFKAITKLSELVLEIGICGISKDASEKRGQLRSFGNEL